MADPRMELEDDEIEESDAQPKKGGKAKKEKKPKEPKPKKEKKPKEPKPPKPPKPPKEKKEKSEGGGGSAVLGKIIKVFLFLLIVGGISAFLFFNVLGVRQKYIIPQFRRIPVVKNFIPYLEGEEPEIVDETNPDSGLNKNQLLEKIAMLEKEIQDLNTDGANKDDEIEKLRKQIIDLEVFKNEQETFKKNKEEFDIMLGRNDPDAYAAFYEQIDPETAQQLYTEAVTQKAIDQETKKQIAAFQEMKAAPAAALLEEMMRTDMNLVVLIVENLDAKQKAAVLAAMTPRNASSVTRRIIPSQ